jgi:hypothetical protein
MVMEGDMTLRSIRLLLAATVFAAATSIGSSATATVTELIANGDFSGGATGFSTTYIGTDDAGYIYLTTNPALVCSSCFPNMGDHTSGSGNLLLIDGSGTGQLPYYSVSVQVVPNSDYTFSYWTANLGTSGENPVLATYLNGSLIGSTFTPAYGQWTEFTYALNSGPLSLLTFDLADLTQTHLYNDFAFDDVSLVGPAPQSEGVPEPSTWAMMLLGFGAAGVVIRRSRKKALATA